MDKRTLPQGDLARSQILAYIKAYWLENKSSPTRKEIQDYCHISSSSVVDYHLRMMERQGMIEEMARYKSRQIVPRGLTITIA